MVPGLSFFIAFYDFGVAAVWPTPSQADRTKYVLELRGYIEDFRSARIPAPGPLGVRMYPMDRTVNTIRGIAEDVYELSLCDEVAGKYVFRDVGPELLTRHELVPPVGTDGAVCPQFEGFRSFVTAMTLGHGDIRGVPDMRIAHCALLFRELSEGRTVNPRAIPQYVKDLGKALYDLDVTQERPMRDAVSKYVNAAEGANIIRLVLDAYDRWSLHQTMRRMQLDLKDGYVPVVFGERALVGDLERTIERIYP